MAKFIRDYPPQLIQNIIKSNLSGALSANLLIPFIVTYLFYNSIPLFELYTWLALHVAIFISRIIFEDKINTNTNIHFFLLSLTSFLFAVLAWMSLVYADDIHSLFVGMIIASVVAGSISTIVSVYHIFVVFVSIQLLGLISSFIYMGEDIFYLCAFLASAFLYLVIASGHKQFTTLLTSLKLSEQVHDLLDNAGQGFLSFDENLKCDSSFSTECTRILNTQKIKDNNISELLFSNSISDKELFCDGIKRTLDTDDYAIKEMFLSLVPKEQLINNIPIKIECKALKNKKFSLILTDITKTKNLKESLQHQNEVQHMIVAVASNKNDFMEIKDSFEEFTINISNQVHIADIILKSILRDLHTFKGIFIQKDMINIPQAIYELELKLVNISSNDMKIQIIKEAKLEKEFDEDLKIINSILGEWFLHSQKLINVHTDAIDDIELHLTQVHGTLDTDKKNVLNDVIQKVQKLKYRSLKRMLSPYISHVKQMSINLEKEVYPLEIIGDDSIKIAPKFKNFIGSLVHLFNNCIDHGIQDIDKRSTLGKNEFGSITCNYQIIADTLVIEISDDGSGIDIDKLSLSAISKNIISEKELKLMSDEEKCKLIFVDNVTTKNSISKISGVGIGMSAIKENLDKLNGKYSIQNRIGDGVTFSFYLPLTLAKDKYMLSINKCTNICYALTTQIEIFLQENLSLEIKKIYEINDILIKTNYAQIDLYDGFNGSIIVMFNSSLKHELASKMIPQDFSPTDISWMTDELPDEILNTVIGLSLEPLSKDFGIIQISPPIHNDNFHLTKLIENSQNKYMQEIDTSLGKITIIVLQKDK